ncbi:MAG: DUF962 domain-containing protein [Flavobacteriales bacterium]
MPARSIHAWFAEYGESHRNAVNTLIHWVCVPAIYFSIIGLLMSIPPYRSGSLPGSPWVWMALLGVLLFYIRRSLPLAVGMAIWSLFCVWLAHGLRMHAPWPLWAICTGVFTLAWIGQFYGHHIEGAKPSFLKDLQFLLIGPAWLMAKLYRRLGIPF